MKAIRAFNDVHTHGGGMVPGLANRNGYRNHNVGRNTTGWGGLRIKNILVEEVGRWLHADAVSAKLERTTKLLVQLTQDDFPSDEELSDDE